MRTTARLLKDGRVTVDHRIRDELGVEHGDLVELTVKPVDEGSD